VEFFVIRVFTRIHKGKRLRWRCAAMARREAVREQKKKHRRQRNRIGMVIINEKGFTLKYISVKEIVGRNVARKADAAGHLRAGKLEIDHDAPMCAGQRAVKSSLRTVTRDVYGS
jgi:hypothetical protein